MPNAYNNDYQSLQRYIRLKDWVNENFLNINNSSQISTIIENWLNDHSDQIPPNAIITVSTRPVSGINANALYRFTGPGEDSDALYFYDALAENPWIRIGGGSTGGGLIHVNSLPSTGIDTNSIYECNDLLYFYDIDNSEWILVADWNHLVYNRLTNEGIKFTPASGNERGPYYNTDLYPKNNVELEICCDWNNNLVGLLCGCSSTDSTMFYISRSAAAFANQKIDDGLSDYWVEGKNIAILNNQGITINGTLIAWPSTPTSSWSVPNNRPLYLGDISEATPLSDVSSFKGTIYYAKLTNDNKEYWFVPIQSNDAGDVCFINTKTSDILTPYRVDANNYCEYVSFTPTLDAAVNWLKVDKLWGEAVDNDLPSTPSHLHTLSSKTTIENVVLPQIENNTPTNFTENKIIIGGRNPMLGSQYNHYIKDSNYSIATTIQGTSADDTTLPTSTAVKNYIDNYFSTITYDGELESEE